MRKISPSSTYNKILVLLESIKSKKFDNKEGLEIYVMNLNQPIFFVKKYKAPPIDALVPEYSLKSLKKVIRLCMVLSLINEQGITTFGRDSLKRNNFNKTKSAKK